MYLENVHLKRIFIISPFLMHLDMDGDGKIGRDDLEQMLDKITDQPLLKDDKIKIIDQVRGPKSKIKVWDGSLG